LNMTAPQVHIKARFIEVEQDNNSSLGFDWYLGQINVGNVVGNGGSAPSFKDGSPTYNGLPIDTGFFPGQTPASQIAGSSANQLITGGLRNTGPTLATITGILTDPRFRVVIRALEQRTGFESLAEPEVITTSGRQTQMRATEIQTIITSFNFQQGNAGATVTTATPTQ